MSLVFIDSPEVAQGVHYVSSQSVSVSRLCCGSVSLVVTKDNHRVRLEIDRDEWDGLVAQLQAVSVS